MQFRVKTLAALAALVVLGACGGGGDGGTGPVTEQPQSCSVADQNTWLASYMDDWYFWYGLSPKPSPAAYTSVDSYFHALLYTGGTAPFPADRWSFTEPQAQHDAFYGAGQTLGYGLFVAGLEILDTPTAPLRARYIEPLSPAALAGLQRGDQILSVNGRAASDMAAANDFAALTPAKPGDQVVLQVHGASGDRTLTLTAATYDLKPVSTASVIDTGNGRRTGYLVLKDFIDQAVPALDAAFASFQSAAIDDLVLDLRYNGGGLVSTASTLASYVAGPARSGQVFARLLYNDKHAGSNQTWQFASLASALGVRRVFILAGQRTCSASELVINGLRPYMDVVLVGGTTCGKPVGFLPISQCGTSFNVVNFEGVNSRNEGRYFDGLQPTCAVADDLDHPLGSPDEAQLAAARYYAVNGACPAGTAASSHTAKAMGAQRDGARRMTREPGEHSDMLAR